MPAHADDLARALRAALEARMAGTAEGGLGSGGLGRRERRKLEVRHRILLAAAALFAEQGLAETKVAEICERADVAHKTFFNHFPSRQHVIRALAEEAMGVLLEAFEGIRKEPGSTRDRLRSVFALTVDHLEAWGPLQRELVTEFVLAAQETRTEEERARQLALAFGALVADGRAQGDVSRRHPVETLTEMVLGAFYALIFGWAHTPGYPVRERALAASRFLADAMEPHSEENAR